MIKNISRLESIIENKVGHFLLDSDTPIHIAKEMLFQFLKYIGQIEDAARAQQDQSETVDKPVQVEELPKSE